jgi:hypothetical protein
MPRRFELGELITMCKQQVDGEGQESLGPTECKRMLGTLYAELYQEVAKPGLRYFETTVELTSDGSDHLAEPEGHLATIGLDYLASATDRRELEEISAQDRNRFIGATGEARAYALVDDEIRLYPTPPSGHVFELLYIPQPPSLMTVADTYQVDVVTADGEAFLIWGFAVMALGKEDSSSDARLARSERDAAKERLIEWAALRSFHNMKLPQVSPGPEHRLPGDWERWGW